MCCLWFTVGGLLPASSSLLQRQRHCLCGGRRFGGGGSGLVGRARVRSVIRQTKQHISQFVGSISRVAVVASEIFIYVYTRTYNGNTVFVVNFNFDEKQHLLCLNVVRYKEYMR